MVHDALQTLCSFNLQLQWDVELTLQDQTRKETPSIGAFEYLEKNKSQSVHHR